jgi:hypothetical protein
MPVVLRVALFCLLSAAAVSSAGTATIALTGQSAPDGNGVFGTFSDPPALNASGQVAINAFNMTGTAGGTLDNAGVYFFNGTTLLLRARENAAEPGGNGTFQTFGSVLLNNLGQVSFISTLRNTTGGANDDTAVYLHNGSALQNLVRENASVPEGNGTFSGFSTATLGASGQVVVSATLRNTTGGSNDDTGIYVHTGAIVANRARENAALPEGNGSFSFFSNPFINSSGQVAFQAVLRGTSGGTLDDTGLYAHNGATLTNLVRENDAVPEGNGLFSLLFNPSINAVGQVAFEASLRSTSGGSSDDSGLYLHTGTSLINLVRENAAAPNGGLFSSFSDPALNSSQMIAFQATLRNTVAGTLDDSGLYLRDGSIIKELARENVPVPDGNGVFDNFTSVAPLLNGTGQVAFVANLRNTSGGLSDSSGIYLADTLEQVLVVRAGQMLAGKTVSVVSVASNTAGEDGRRTGLNNFGQVAYRATFTDTTEGIFLFTPELRFRQNTHDNWDDNSAWTLGLRPAAVHDVRIDPAASVTVLGPAAATSVKSLQIGGGSGIATLELQLGGSIASATPVVVQPTGVLTGDGQLIATVNNNGTVRANNLTITGFLNNNAVITGSGRINARLNNNAGGEVRVGEGQSIHFTAATNSNAGRIEVIGGQIEFDSSLNNIAGGNLVARNAAVRFGGGVVNAGEIAFSFGTSDLFGAVNNLAGGRVIVSGGGNATFYDDITLSAGSEFRVSTGAAAVFFGFVSGSGNFTGSGTKFFEGGSAATLDRLTSGGATVVAADAELSADVIRESSLSVEGAAQIRSSSEASRVNALSIPDDGVVDLTAGTLVYDYTGATPLGTVRTLLAEGYAAGGWNGTGINSSTAATTPNRAIGLAEAVDIGSPPTFAGQNIDASALLLRFTIPGDANLDRVVNIGDFALLAANFNLSSYWAKGDFNYNGVTNIGDFALLAANFNTSLPRSTPVPEPSTVIACAIATAALSRRRRLQFQAPARAGATPARRG